MPRRDVRSVKNFLAKPVNNKLTSQATMIDELAMTLLEPFRPSLLPFGCTLLGWASKRYHPDAIGQVLLAINNLTTVTGLQIVSSEGFGHNLQNGTVHIVGVYPLLDLDSSIRMQEYRRVSFLHNRETTENLLQWSYSSLLHGALATDEVGIICAILAEDDSIAEMKLNEAITLFQHAMER